MKSWSVASGSLARAQRSVASSSIWGKLLKEKGFVMVCFLWKSSERAVICTQHAHTHAHTLLLPKQLQTRVNVISSDLLQVLSCHCSEQIVCERGSLSSDLHSKKSVMKE